MFLFLKKKLIKKFTFQGASSHTVNCSEDSLEGIICGGTFLTYGENQGKMTNEISLLKTHHNRMWVFSFKLLIEKCYFVYLNLNLFV